MSAARRAGAPAAGWRPARAGGGAAAPGASLAAAFLLAAATLAGCGGTPAASGASPAALSGDLTLLAAASLTEGFTDLAKDFERRHPGVHVHLSFAGSPTLAAQVEQGAPADLIATADAATIDRLAGEGLLNGTPETVATNRLEIAVAHGNPAGVHGLADLARPGLRVALCAATVPCGKGAATALARAGVQVSPVTLDPDVKSVLSHVSLGAADAGIVYATDVIAAGQNVTGVAIPAAANVSNVYPMARLKHAPATVLAQVFFDYARSAPALDILGKRGFAPPSG